MHATFTQLFKTVFTPSCDACGADIPNNDDILCPSCRDRLERQAILTEMKVVDEVRVTLSECERIQRIR